ncbi:LysR substrate-binding domain-containing protein [Nocardioides limicola]|uniref:LysR substrate-binding domain-containing protein n=1 Tax=Nocardioides limicola TaxID=2803368 RepID=UPI00193AF527|nr:LysR substrate-binding domain-containing protein [Nocardioides sp. DJM-14]
MFTVGFVPGVTPTKWFRRWQERHPATPVRGFRVEQQEQWAALAAGEVRMLLARYDAAFNRPEELHLIPLYDEQPVVIAPADHFVAAAEEVELTELDGELAEYADAVLWADRVATVAAGAGLLLAPMAVAREFHRKDLIWRPVTDAAVTSVGLAWPRADEDPLIEEFIGVVRGRTANSTRGRAPKQPGPARTVTAQRSAAPGKARKPARSGSGRAGPRRRSSGR